MLQTLWVLLHWEDVESLVIVAVPFQLFFFLALLIIKLIVRFRGRIPVFWANVLAGGIAGLVAGQVCMMTVPYALDFKDYRESVRQLEVQERLRQQRESPALDALPVGFAGGMAGLEALKVLVATLPYWFDDRAQRESARQLENQARLQPQKVPEAVGLNPERAPEEVSAP